MRACTAQHTKPGLLDLTLLVSSGTTKKLSQTAPNASRVPVQVRLAWTYEAKLVRHLDNNLDQLDTIQTEEGQTEPAHAGGTTVKASASWAFKIAYLHALACRQQVQIIQNWPNCPPRLKQEMQSVT